MKTPNVEVRKMNQFGVKYEQFYTKADSEWDCHTGEWKKGFVRFIEDRDSYNNKLYRVIVGDRELVGQECWVTAKEKKHWQSEFENAGFEVRYEKKTKKSQKNGAYKISIDWAGDGEDDTLPNLREITGDYSLTFKIKTLEGPGSCPYVDVLGSKEDLIKFLKKEYTEDKEDLDFFTGLIKPVANKKAKK